MAALLMRSSMARSAGIIPALRRASGSSSSASLTRPLAYHSRQAGYSNGGGGASDQKQRSEFFMDQIMTMKREEKIYRRFLLGFFALSGGYAIYSGVAIGREIKAEVLREEAFNKTAAARREAVKGTWV